MTVRTESRLTVAANIDDVWAYLCDVGRWSEWAPTVVECRVSGGGPLAATGWIEQRAKDLGVNHRRRERVTVVDAPRSLAFAGTMWTSPARWGMEFERVDEGRTDAMMWVEVDLAHIMRVVPERALARQIQRVSDIEMTRIKAAVESDARRAGVS
jgi:mRNA-degrading endonuclease toxin of MazEF toxin-antitoxin module